jgi:hypothetical protein
LLPSDNFVQILPESGSALHPDVHSSKVLDPDPYITNADPKHCGTALKNLTQGRQGFVAGLKFIRIQQFNSVWTRIQSKRKKSYMRC